MEVIERASAGASLDFVQDRAPASLASKMTEAETDAQLVETLLKTKANMIVETWRAYDCNQGLLRSFKVPF